MEKREERETMMGAVLKALLTAYAATAAILLLLAFGLLKFQLDTQKTGLAILVCYVGSCFLGGWLCGHRAGKKKFLWGLLTGALYFALLFFLSGMNNDTLPMDTIQILTAFALCAGSGMAGGMIS